METWKLFQSSSQIYEILHDRNLTGSGGYKQVEGSPGLLVTFFYFKKGNTINRQTDKENNKILIEVSYKLIWKSAFQAKGRVNVHKLAKNVLECFSLPSIPGMYDRVKFARGERKQMSIRVVAWRNPEHVES